MHPTNKPKTPKQGSRKQKNKPENKRTFQKMKMKKENES